MAHQQGSLPGHLSDLLGDLTVQPTEQSLTSQILHSFTEANFHDPPRRYLPRRKIEDLINEESVKIELDKIPAAYKVKFNEQQRSLLAVWVAKHARKVFATALQCDLEPYHLLLAMAVFQHQSFTDDRLPLPDHQKKRPPPEIFPEAIWAPLKLDNFCDRQWKFLVPIFTKDEYNRDFSEKYIFPFTSDGAVPKDGAFSSVFRVKIHPDHRELPGINDVALKELKVPIGDERSDVDKAWEIEAVALEAINKIDHDHILKCIAAMRRGKSRYFMFPWADGDSLRDFWENAPRQALDADIVKETIMQLRGIADALDHLHNFDGGRVAQEGNHDVLVFRSENEESGEGAAEINLDSEVNDYKNVMNAESIRHGDLKPENILRFHDQHSRLGYLKIADMGLAKRHVVATGLRGKATSTRYGTRRYEAPETITAKYARSRLYDIWSMGCITFEFIVWLLYGNDELKNLYKQIEGSTQQICQYYELVNEDEIGGAKVHPTVEKWMDHIQNKDPECQSKGASAIKDLLKIVREKLLIVPLPPNRLSSQEGGRLLSGPSLGTAPTRFRATASEFREALDEMMPKIKQAGYLFTGSDRTSAKPPATSHLSAVASSVVPAQGPLKSGVLGRPLADHYALPPMKDWEFFIDNAFAGKLISEIGSEALSPQAAPQNTLCSECKELDFWKGGFAIEVKVSDLEERAQRCDLCKMLFESLKKSDTPTAEKARFVRSQSKITASGDPFPVLSILRHPLADLPLAIQMGFPELPLAGTNNFFKIIKLWLDDCDKTHKSCNGSQASLPTRLIDVGSVRNPLLVLIESKEHGAVIDRYIALSHPWGDPIKCPPFSTLRKNVDEFRRAIPEHQLPATFVDAIKCARKLGIRYLWIDSLCIIQGPDGDFVTEAKRMEDVFSGAYCILAASRANNQRDGFLDPVRPKRDYVTFQRNSQKPFYICQNIDNFSKDVIEGSLNKRGWVLQERALARRTIYFTETQTYFECGNGVRCETLTKMSNNLASFLGDPSFPSKAMRENRASKIAYFQALYKQYSRLNFTRYSDKPIAIAGLERRLQEAFSTRGAFGIFDDGDKEDGGLFHRSLLWQRGEEKGDEDFLTPIQFPPESHMRVPSWSWMAYQGGITYIDPPFQTADWEMKEIVPPWTMRGNQATHSEPQDEEVALLATVRDFTVAGRQPGEVELAYDTERTRASDGQRTQCVIVARSKSIYQIKRYHVLLVASTGILTGRAEKIYRRVGAGVMLGKFISLDGKGTQARII